MLPLSYQERGNRVTREPQGESDARTAGGSGRSLTGLQPQLRSAPDRPGGWLGVAFAVYVLLPRCKRPETAAEPIV